MDQACRNFKCDSRVSRKVEVLVDAAGQRFVDQVSTDAWSIFFNKIFSTSTDGKYGD
jgi:hypothetical protein